VRRMLTPTSERRDAAEQHADPNVRALQQELTDRLGSKVLIQQGSGGKGKVVIGYNSLDELDGILAHIQ
jgi:ParB family transcriptional regulator, chromosome partitioning protein